MTKSLLAIIVSLLLINAVHAAHLHKEAEYRDAWCQGETETILSDGTRADCITDQYAIEIDFAKKWSEGIGQALHYARLTGKTPGLALIIETEKDWKHFNRARKTAKKHGIKLWPIKPEAIH